MTKPLARVEGRLFSEAGCLFLVVHADEAAGLARVTCRMDGQVQVVEMPLSDVVKRVASSTGLMLDNLNAPETARRIFEEQDGWYFTSREGRIGPFGSRKRAGHQLVSYILSMQTVDRAPGAPARAARSRRREAVAG